MFIRRGLVVVINAMSLAILISGGLDIMCTMATAQETEDRQALPPECEEDLARGAAALKLCTLDYSLKKVYAVERPGSRVVSQTGHCVLADGEFYYKYTRILSGAGDKPPIIEEMAFNGLRFYFGSPTLQKPLLHKMLGENRDDETAETLIIDVPYLTAIGFPVPGTVSAWRSSRMRSSVIESNSVGRLLKSSRDGTLLSLEFEVPDDAVTLARRVDLDAMAKQSGWSPDSKAIQSYIKLRGRNPLRRIQVTLDQAKGYAMQYQQQYTMDGEHISSIECEDFEFFPETEVWIPRKCKVLEYLTFPQFLAGFTEEPSISTYLTLDNIAFSVPEGVNTTLDYGPSSVVVERSIDAARGEIDGEFVYEVPVSPEEAQVAAKSVLKSSRSWFMIVGNLVLWLIVIIVVTTRVTSRR